MFNRQTERDWERIRSENWISQKCFLVKEPKQKLSKIKACSFNVHHGINFQRSLATAGLFLETASRSEVSYDADILNHLKYLLVELQADSGVQECVRCTKHIQDSAAYFFQQVSLILTCIQIIFGMYLSTSIPIDICLGVVKKRRCSYLWIWTGGSSLPRSQIWSLSYKQNFPGKFSRHLFGLPWLS